jgi:hypothetical protein
MANTLQPAKDDEDRRRLLNNLKFAANVNGQTAINVQGEGWLHGQRALPALPGEQGQALNIERAGQHQPITPTDQPTWASRLDSFLTMVPITTAIVYRACGDARQPDGLRRLSRIQEDRDVCGHAGVPPGSTGTLPQAANDVYLRAGSRRPRPGSGCAILTPKCTRTCGSWCDAVQPGADDQQNYKKRTFKKRSALASGSGPERHACRGPLGGTPTVTSANVDRLGDRHAGVDRGGWPATW